MGLKEFAKDTLPPSIWRMLRKVRSDYSIASFPARDVEHVYYGFPLKVHLADPTGQGWYDRDWPEMPEFDVLKNYRLRPGALVFDLGAHQSVVALMIGRIVGPSGKVIALEASSHDAEVSRRNCELNKPSYVEVVHAAVAKESGSIEFTLNGSVSVGDARAGKVTVPAWSINSLIEQHGQPDLIFLDVEGYEGEALAGASRAFNGKTDFFVEVHTGVGLEAFGSSVTTILNYFPESQFDLFFKHEDDPQFVRLSPNFDLAQRFFLVAACKSSSGV